MSRGASTLGHQAWYWDSQGLIVWNIPWKSSQCILTHRVKELKWFSKLPKFPHNLPVVWRLFWYRGLVQAICAGEQGVHLGLLMWERSSTAVRQRYGQPGCCLRLQGFLRGCWGIVAEIEQKSNKKINIHNNHEGMNSTKNKTLAWDWIRMYYYPNYK